MKNKDWFHRFTASPLGSLVRHWLFSFLTALTTLYTANVDNFKVDWMVLKTLCIAAGFAVMPMILNWLSPGYKNFGK